MRRTVVGGLLLLLPVIAIADDDDHHDRARSSLARARATAEWSVYEEECGACHLAYPPAFLPKGAWEALLGGLADHFGQNAELDPDTQAKLGAWLARWAAESGSRRAPGPPPLRITDLPSWRQEHDELSPAVFRRASVGSRANCPACHLDSDQGRFDDDAVKIPKDAPPPR